MSELKTIEECRAFWAGVATANGWYTSPFYVQVWLDSDGNIADSVSYQGIKQDYVIPYTE